VQLTGGVDAVRATRTEIRLYEDSDRIDVVVDVDKLPVLAKEAVYVAFPFALRAPRLRYDRQQGWVDPLADHQPGACNEWLALQHAVVLEDPGLAVTLACAEAPMVTVGDVARGTWARSFEPHGTVLSWVMHNYWFTDCPPTQEGRLRLRYAVLPTAVWDPVASARLGRELRTPPAVNQVTWLDKSDADPRPLGMAAASLLRHDWPTNVVATLHAPRRGGAGVAFRLQEVGGVDTDVELPDAFGAGGSASLCNALEVEVQRLERRTSGRHTVSVPAWAVRTLLLRPPGEGAA
jgi:alpha-mannosidase